MRVAIVHNRYALSGRGSGEEVMVEAIQGLLEARGHRVFPYIRSSLQLQEMPLGHVRAFFSGIYNVPAQRAFARFLTARKPDLVLIQNLFPLLSPSILVACRRMGVPVLMRCPNYRLICPNGRMMTKGQICEKCSGGKEYWCLLKNCEDNLLKSMGYAMRNFVARQLQLFHHNVDIFMVLTPFARQKFIDNGFLPQRVQVLSALVDPSQFQPPPTVNSGSYIGFVGRVSPEKGVDTLIQAARLLPDIPFKVAGPDSQETLSTLDLPHNVSFLGQLDRQALERFYQEARIIVVPSRWYEGLPVVILEAMLAAKPIICSRLGGLPDVVDEGITGLLFQHDSHVELKEKIEWLWRRIDTCRCFGIAGRKKAETDFHPDAFYERLMFAYHTSLALRAN
jgi:glycosyltransferase involved in cell wall biosynthesis